MPIQFDKFDQKKIDAIRTQLENNAAKFSPKYYEIFVDGLKAVNKTNLPEEFDNYEDYMTPNTNTIKIVLYGSGKSPRNDQFVFSMKAKDQQEALDLGLGGLESKSYTTKELEELRREREKRVNDAHELETLRVKVVELNKTLSEKETYISSLEDGLAKAAANGNKIGGIHLGEIASVFFENLVIRNKHRIAQIPGLEGLAGFLADPEPNNTETEQPKDSQSSFTKKNSSENQATLSEQEKEFIRLFHDITKGFTPDQIGQVIDVLVALKNDKTQLKPVLELLK